MQEKCNCHIFMLSSNVPREDVPEDDESIYCSIEAAESTKVNGETGP